MFENRDATEVIHAFHSDAAHTMLKRLPKLPVRDDRSLTFRAFRVSLACALARTPLTAHPRAPSSFSRSLSQAPPAGVEVPDVTPAQRAFRLLRAKLIADGWFARNYVIEAAHLVAWAACVAAGVACAHAANATVAALAWLPLGLSFTAAGTEMRGIVCRMRE
jgi:hypothetical protein